MSTQTRAGIRAARALLSLLEENSAEELEAAEAILSGEKELTNILQLLRKFKEHEEEPLSIERLREIVRSEILSLPLSIPDMFQAIVSTTGPAVSAPARTVENMLDQTLVYIEERLAEPGERVNKLINLLLASAALAGTEHMEKVAALLRDLAIQSLTENLVMFPTLHSLAQLRTRWAKEPLSYKHQEPRRRLVTRLLKDAEQLPVGALRKTTVELLREGLRGPADAVIADVRRMKPKKAHGE